MNIDNSILKSKFKQGGYIGYDYLIDNAETRKDKKSLLRLKNLLSIVEQTFISTGEIDLDDYYKEQNAVFEKLGLPKL